MSVHVTSVRACDCAHVDACYHLNRTPSSGYTQTTKERTGPASIDSSLPTQRYASRCEIQFEFRLESQNESVEKFMRRRDQGKLKEVKKSAQVQDGWDDQPVKELVASQWDTFVQQNKHVRQPQWQR
eukprot:3362199-Rhodomonas_salina.2